MLLIFFFLFGKAVLRKEDLCLPIIFLSGWALLKGKCCCWGSFPVTIHLGTICKPPKTIRLEVDVHTHHKEYSGSNKKRRR